MVTYKLITINKNTISADFSDSLGRYHLTMRKSYLSQDDINCLDEGGYIVDLRPALERNIRVAFTAPILNLDKPFGYIEGTDGIKFENSLGANSVRFNNLVLKEVGLGAFVEFWRRSGANIGIKENGKIIWSIDLNRFIQKEIVKLNYLGEC